MNNIASRIAAANKDLSVGDTVSHKDLPLYGVIVEFEPDQEVLINILMDMDYPNMPPYVQSFFEGDLIKTSKEEFEVQNVITSSRIASSMLFIDTNQIISSINASVPSNLDPKMEELIKKFDDEHHDWEYVESYFDNTDENKISMDSLSEYLHSYEKYS